MGKDVNVKEIVKEAMKGLIQAKAQLTESGDVHLNVNINIGNKTYATPLPEDVTAQEVKSAEITPEIQKLIEEEVGKRLKQRLLPQGQPRDKDRLGFLTGLPPSPDELNQLAASSTLACFTKLVLLKGMITPKGEAKGKLTVTPPPSTDLPDKDKK
jgi:hypothetical protein